MQAFRGHALAWRLKRHDRHTKRDSEKGCKGAAKGMANDPEVCVGKHQCDIVVEVLKNSIVSSARDSEEQLNLQSPQGKIGSL